MEPKVIDSPGDGELDGDDQNADREDVDGNEFI